MFKKLKKIIVVVSLLSLITTIAGPTNYNDQIKTETNGNQIVFTSNLFNRDTKTFDITNHTTEVQSYTVLENLQNPFFYEGVKTFNLMPNQSKKIEIAFTPTKEGKYNSKIDILNNYDQSRKEIYLTAYTKQFIPNEFISDEIINLTNLNENETLYINVFNLSNIDKTIYISPSERVQTVSIVKLKAFEQKNIEFKLLKNYKDSEYIKFYDNGTLLSKTEIITSNATNSTSEVKEETTKKAILSQETSHLNLTAKKDDLIMKSFYIYNQGDKTANLELQKLESKHLTVKYPKQIQANSKAEIKVIYKPTYNQNIISEIIFNTDASNTKEIKVTTNLNSYGFINTNEEIKLNLDQKIYKLNKNQNLNAFIETNQDTLVNAQVKKDGVVILNLGTVKIFKDTINPIIWNKNNIAGEKVENGTYQLVINAISSDNSKTISSRIIVGSKTENKIINQNLAYIDAKEKTTIFTSQTNETFAVIYPNCEYKYNLEIKVKLPYQHSTKINSLNCNETFEIKTPSEIIAGELKLETIISTNKEKFTKEFTITAKDIEETVKTETYNSKQNGVFASNISQNIAYKNQNIYINFAAEKQGYLKAVVNGSGLKKPYNLALYRYYDKGTYLNNLVIPKNTLSEGEYNVELEFTQNSEILKNQIKLIIIDQSTKLEEINQDECINQYFCQEDTAEEVNEKNSDQSSKYLTRLQAIELTVKLLGINSRDYEAIRDSNLSFSDLNKNSGSELMAVKSNTVNQAKNNEFTRRILEGYKNNEMKLEQKINRAEFYKIMFEAMNNSKTVKLNALIDYNQENKPFFDTQLTKETMWYLPYAELIKENFTNTTYAKNYFNSFDLYSSKARFKATSFVSKEEAIDFINTALTKGIITN